MVEEIYLKCQNPALEAKLDFDAMFSDPRDAEYYKTTRPLDVDMQYFTFEENTAN